ncbi:HAD family hydrolase [Candidatus Bathycorpusculum sp.]|jgi:putative hydrolase of the HAD superfamily|uniref:HAD family hydrolase n=1 Tax=Candidatus Bathycorpusculum sp. TaxID=2994959 RepID=UPI0031CC4E4E
MLPLRAVLFDMFDTLMLIERDHEFYEPAVQRMYRYLCKRGVDVSYEQFVAAYNAERTQLYEKADLNLEEPHFNVRISGTLKRLGYSYPTTSSVVSETTCEFYEEFMKYVRIDPDAESVLKVLHENYRLGIVSNFAIPECVYKLLRISGIDHLFEVVVVSGSINKRKPSPEIFQSALQMLGVSATETVFVGDTIDADIEGAKTAGMQAVYIERRVQKETEICPDQIIKSLAELPEVLKRCQKNTK